MAPVRHLAYCLAAAVAAGGSSGAGAFHELRPESEHHTIAAAAGYTGEAWHLAEGGARTGTRYIDKLEIGVEVDGERAFGVAGLRLFANLMHAGGDGPGADLVGDAQGISGNEAEDAPWLRELWIEQQFGHAARHRTLAGFYDVSSEFDVTPSAQLFTGAAHGTGTDFAQSGANGPSVFPASGLALRHTWHFGEAWQLQAATVDGVPGDPDHPDRLSMDLDEDEGVLWLAELARNGTRVHKLALGYWEYSASFERLDSVDAAGEARRADGNRGAYALADLVLIDAGADSAPRLSAFVRAGFAEPAFNRFEHYLGAGLVMRGLLPRGDDQLGLGVSHARSGAEWRDYARVNGLPRGRSETNIELTWQIPVGEHVLVQPVVQYVLDPDTDAAIDDALVFGVRLEVAFEATR